jgi:hypothetical protein
LARAAENSTGCVKNKRTHALHPSLSANFHGNVVLRLLQHVSAANHHRRALGKRQATTRNTMLLYVQQAAATLIGKLSELLPLGRMVHRDSGRRGSYHPTVRCVRDAPDAAN